MISSKLNCGSKLPVVFLINCLTGKYDEECLAYNLLKSPTGGCIASIAASNESPIEENSYLHEGIFDTFYGLGIGADYNDSIKVYGKNHEIGKLLNIGMTKCIRWRYSHDYRSMWNCIGDPATYIRTDIPKSIDRLVSVSRSEGDTFGWDVDLHGSYAKIIFYNPKTKKHVIYLSETYVFFETSETDRENWIITIKRGDDKPYIHYGNNIYTRYSKYIFD